MEGKKIVYDIESTEKYLTEQGIHFKVINKCFNFLSNQTVHHEAAFTVKEGLERVKFDGEHEHTIFAKNLFLHNKKKKDQLFLVVAAHDTEVNLKALEKHLKTGSSNLRAAEENVMEEILGVKKGSVCLFAILNDKDKKVSLLIDARLLADGSQVGFHPMINTATTSLKKDDLLKIVALAGHTHEVIDFTKLE